MGLLDALSKGDGPAVVNSVSAFVIRVGVADGGLSGSYSGAIKEFRMQGRGLPHRPFSLVGRQRIAMTWLAGYSHASAQLLGPEDKETTIRGRWSDRWISENEQAAADLGPLGNTFSGIDNAIGSAGATIGLGSQDAFKNADEVIPITYEGVRVQTAFEAITTLDDLMRTGTPVEVQWDRHARRGFIAEVKQDWLNSHDVEWEVTFAWTSHANPTESVSTPELSLSDTASLLQNLAEALNADALPPTFPMANDILADISAGILRISAFATKLSNTVVNIATLAISPFTVARSVIALSTSIVTECDNLRNTLRTQPDIVFFQQRYLRQKKLQESDSTFVSDAQDEVDNQGQFAASPSAALPEPYGSQTDSLVAAEYLAIVIPAVREIRSQALIQRDEYRKRLERQTETVVTARAQDSLRSLARLYYGDSRQWQRIAIANQLDGSDLEIGQQVIIPLAVSDEGC